MNAEKILKSIHVLSHMSVRLLDRDFNVLASFSSGSAAFIGYDVSQLTDDAIPHDQPFSLITGHYSELFILYKLDERYALIGPFRVNKVNRAATERKLASQDVPRSEWKTIVSYFEGLPVYALGDVRDIIIHLHFCFTGEIEDPLHDELHAYLRNFYLELDREIVGSCDDRTFDPHSYLYYYESEILSYVNAGRVEALKEMVFKLGSAVVPSTSGDILRSEKNYSIVVFQKLSRAAIDAGCDIVEATVARDAFIRRTEEAGTLQQALKIRDAAIVYYTAEVGKTLERGYSQLVTGIVQFIGLNTNRALRVQHIADAFHLSTSAIQKKFKAETGITVQQYITLRKIEEAKVMLKSGLTVAEVAFALGFFDSSHFSRTFKKIAHTTPKAYQQAQPQLPPRERRA